MRTPAAEAEAQRVVPLARARGIGGKERVLTGSQGCLSRVGDRIADGKCMGSINALCTRPTGCCGVIGRTCLLWHGVGVGRRRSVTGAVLRRGEVCQGACWLPLVSFHEVSKECGLIWGALWGVQEI